MENHNYNTRRETASQSDSYLQCQIPDYKENNKNKNMEIGDKLQRQQIKTK